MHMFSGDCQCDHCREQRQRVPKDEGDVTEVFVGPITFAVLCAAARANNGVEVNGNTFAICYINYNGDQTSKVIYRRVRKIAE